MRERAIQVPSVCAGMTLVASPPWRDDPVHLVEGPEVLAQQPDRHLRDRERVGRVDPELGRDRRRATRGPCTATRMCATALTRG